MVVKLPNRRYLSLYCCMLLACCFLPCAGLAQGRSVGVLAASRSAQTAPPGTSKYREGRVGEAVFDGTGIRTQRHAFAQVTFHDKSVLKINERTDVVIHDSSVLRRMALNTGTVWVHVTHGIETSVQTPVGTATARGTEFVVGAKGYLHVIDGTVELFSNGTTLLVHAGQTVTFGASSPALVVEGSLVIGNGLEGIPPDWYLETNGEADQAIIAGGPTNPVGLLGLLLFWPHHGGGGTPGDVQNPTPTPEPTSFVFLGVGAAAVLRKRRK